ncbi:hypothetical protein SISSUDRAFT_655210 [Sistotremastrum suecicum HHB10207 ss-3]|uniref:Uncharacterized protein n=1 Tax=Sistotremastrum suecicum HHB10207 ss-3 TaxID=1314776 RepID=A0A165X3U3_9AGAM|nr:hypothetical protein SISSUDRAFT_655210 [Sistotremastrum suecicum HHB10207 ss-3]
MSNIQTQGYDIADQGMSRQHSPRQGHSNDPIPIAKPFQDTAPEPIDAPISPSEIGAKLEDIRREFNDKLDRLVNGVLKGDKIADGDPQRWLPPFTGKTLIQMWKKVEARFGLKISPFIFVALALLPFMFLIFRTPSYPIFTINLPGLHTGPQPTNHHLALLPGAIAGADQTGSQPLEPPTISLYRANSNIVGRQTNDCSSTDRRQEIGARPCDYPRRH